MTEDSHRNSGIHIDLADEKADLEVSVTLKVAQLDLIYEILSQHIQPKGYDMIEFAYDLFKRLREAVENLPEEEIDPFTAQE